MDIVSCADLISMGRQIPTPFHLSVLKNEVELDLRVDSILRIVPGRRLVALALWQDKTVILKLFYDRKTWKRNMLRDLRGINSLRQAGIPTPELLLQSNTKDKVGGVLLIDYLSTGTGLASLFDKAGDEEAKKEIIDLAIENIARCHRAGLWQEDIHLDNFILNHGVVYVIDGAGVDSVDGALDKEASLNNLARFISQLPPQFDQKAGRFIQSYRKLVSDISWSDSEDFGERVRRARSERLDRYEKKLFRSTTSHRCESINGRFVVYDRSMESLVFEQFIKDPDSFIEENKLIKRGNSSTVALIEIDGSNYVLKRYNMKSLGHRVSRSLRPSRAHQSWRNALVLKMLGISTPTPLLFMENRALGLFRSTAYFLSEYVEGSNFGEEIEKGEIDKARFEESIELFRNLFRTMHTYSISHGDTKASNFIVKEGELVVLDLDAMKRHQSRSSFSEKFSKDLKRFQKNWQGSRFQDEADAAIEALQLEFSG